MTDERSPASSSTDIAFKKAVSKKLARKLRVQRDGKQGMWFGLGMFGLIGWSIALPTFLGAMAGLWWDRHHVSTHSWTLALLIAGLVIGCANAWYWIAQEAKAMQDSEEDGHE
jgi:ATP synthase protein I